MVKHGPKIGSDGLEPQSKVVGKELTTSDSDPLSQDASLEVSTQKTSFDIGERVFWHDPDGGTRSGPGTIVDIEGVDEDGDELVPVFPNTQIWVDLDNDPEMTEPRVTFAKDLEEIEF